ncbi:hypothetical protein F4813DRAFT_354815 [Daldinia decipiens]|uniref:uncharacterized protein n=1 Tax=Daldinia decipiens TaxID=326647 RepID=UPI0020C4911D|nr:uncharacterized protein F4813DRAFT_354815 [Daldinia decipiens]KAI1658830.1 hypothetical protein F4813DRAFT_354815 [Daldinia decipiens]
MIRMKLCLINEFMLGLGLCVCCIFHLAILLGDTTRFITHYTAQARCRTWRTIRHLFFITYMALCVLLLELDFCFLHVLLS